MRTRTPDELDVIIATARSDERERCARIAESLIVLRGGARWALDEEHNQACEALAAALRKLGSEPV